MHGIDSIVSMVCRHTAAVAAAVICLAPAGAQAQSTAPSLILPERVTKIVVTPEVADTGVPREIKISGYWPGCGVSGARISRTDSPASLTVVAKLSVPMTLLPCPAAFVPYTVTTTFTPTARGVHRLMVVGLESELLGEGLIDTRAPDNNASLFNITGMWYDPASNGSGLTFVHSRVNDNVVFGTWYVYDGTGAPRWYTIQNTRWVSSGRVLEGDLVSTAGAARCPPLFAGCPATANQVDVVGRARLTILDTGTIRVEALAADGRVIFRSDAIRAEV